MNTVALQTRRELIFALAKLDVFTIPNLIQCLLFLWSSADLGQSMQLSSMILPLEQYFSSNSSPLRNLKFCGFSQSSITCLGGILKLVHT